MSSYFIKRIDFVKFAFVDVSDIAHTFTANHIRVHEFNRINEISINLIAK